eukprot:3534700-Pyramimonas_sp.AAC.1
MFGTDPERDFQDTRGGRSAECLWCAPQRFLALPPLPKLTSRLVRRKPRRAVLQPGWRLLWNLLWPLPELPPSSSSSGEGRSARGRHRLPFESASAPSRSSQARAEVRRGGCVVEGRCVDRDQTMHRLMLIFLQGIPRARVI